MTLARIIFNNARQRRLSTALTSLTVAVGVALTVAILIIKLATHQRFTLGYSAYDMVIGAKGSPLQLVLNVVYHLDASPGNIPFSLEDQLRRDPRVHAIAPISLGDNYQGFRLIGTSDALLRDFEPYPGQPFELASGRLFHFNEEAVRDAIREAMERGGAAAPRSKKKEAHPHDDAEAVLGATVAEETGLHTGETFVATHGLQANEEGEKHEHTPWTVVGILKPTGTPADRAIYINLDSFYHIEGHVIEAADRATAGSGKPPEPGEISALVLKARSPIAVWALRKAINNRNDTQAAVPAEEIRKLLSIVGNVDRIFLAQAVLIVLVSAAGLALAMFNSMKERRRDIAVMRALGARRSTIMGIIVGEALLVSALGGLLGLGLGHVVVQLAAPAVKAAIGFTIPAWSFHSFEAVLFLGVLGIGAFAGLGPAIAAYRTDVASSLSPEL